MGLVDMQEAGKEDYHEEDPGAQGMYSVFVK